MISVLPVREVVLLVVLITDVLSILVVGIVIKGALNRVKTELE